MPNTEPVVDSAAVLGSLIEDAQREAVDPGRLPRRDHARPGGRRADRDGRARRAGRSGLQRRRPAARRARADAKGLAVPRDRRPQARAALRGADALPRGPDARGSGLGRARVHRLPVGGRERDGRARPVPCGLRGAAAAPAPPLGARVRRGAACRPGERRRRDGRGDAAPPVPHRRGGADARLRT